MASAVKPEDMLIGALLRVPGQVIQRRIIKELNAAGFKELLVPHMAVLQFPGPDGVRPGILAERAGMSKQAIPRTANRGTREAQMQYISFEVHKARRPQNHGLSVGPAVPARSFALS